MPRHRRIARVVAATLLPLLLGVAPARAEPPPPTVIAAIRLDDQHGAPGAVDEQTRMMVLSRDMDAGRLAKEAFDGLEQPFFAARGIVYVADTSGMPALVSRLFALPALRKRPYRILVDADGAATRDLPFEPGVVTVVRLDGLRVTGVDYARTAAALREAVDGVSPR